MEASVLTCYKSQHEKLRIGRENDGGYVICEIPNINYECLLSGGIETDLSFEEDFCKKYENIPCFAYDGTINSIKTNEKRIYFVKQNIGYHNNEKVTNLHHIIKRFNNIFIKMDIEGGEIDWMESLTDEHLNKFSQMVIEFHSPFSARENEVFKKINKTHLLVHFHPNNCCKTVYHMGIKMPHTFECTYVHKKYLNEPYELNKERIPTSIDMKNGEDRDDIELDHPPFVWN